MCTILILNQHHKDFPLVIAANRDENFTRKSSPVQVLTKEPHHIVGGRDEQHGGTWMAANAHSLFAAVTNQGVKDPKLESRGKVVLDILKCKTLKEMLDFVEEIDPSKYNKFNLVFGNNKTVYLAHSYLLHSMVVRELPKGVSVVINDINFGVANAKSQFFHKKFDQEIDKPWLELYKHLKKGLNNSEFRIRTKPKDHYGTVSSSILAFDETGLARYKFYDRTVVRPKKREGDPYIPRYKDYIDIWRDPNATLSASSNDEEKDDADDAKEEALENAKLIFQQKTKPITWKAMDYNKYDDDYDAYGDKG